MRHVHSLGLTLDLALSTNLSAADVLKTLVAGCHFAGEISVLIM
jgi:hypothetical protein